MDNFIPKKVLVTGASGFLGSAIVQKLVNNGVKVIGVSRSHEKQNKNFLLEHYSCDLTSKEQTFLFFENHCEGIDSIIHCAGLDGNAAYKKEFSDYILSENIKMLLNVLELAKIYTVKNLSVMSSTEVYSPVPHSVITESDFLVDFDNLSENGYVYSKVITELICSIYSSNFGIRICIPRLSNLYGPGDAHGIKRGRVIPAMISKILSNDQIEIWGNGEQTRSFLYIDDAADIILKLLSISYVGPINVSSAEIISISSLASILFEMSEKDEKIRFSADKPTGPIKRVFSIEKLDREISFNQVSFLEGLKSTLEWYARHMDFD